MSKPMGTAKPTLRQRITELERLNAALHENNHHTGQLLREAVEKLQLATARATTAEEALEQMRTRAQALYEAIYRGKVSRAEDILREMDPIARR